MPNPWVSLRRDKLIPVNKAVNEKEQLEKGLEEEKTLLSETNYGVVGKTQLRYPHGDFLL
jgi:hypothetical protein